eukprot:SAG22_NODE_2257_length_2780_cov_2.690041_4_plen_68_part_00
MCRADIREGARAAAASATHAAKASLRPAAPSSWYIRGQAYDLQPWLEKHPGGRFILETTRGTDCTEL